MSGEKRCNQAPQAKSHERNILNWCKLDEAHTQHLPLWFPTGRTKDGKPVA